MFFKKTILFFFFLIFLFSHANSLFAQNTQNIPNHENTKKFIYSAEEYKALVRNILDTKMKNYTLRYPTVFEVYYDLPERREIIKVNLLDPPYEISKKMKEEIEDFKTKNKLFFSSKFFYIYLLKERFFFTPIPVAYYGQFTSSAESVFNLRCGNCFSLTNLFVALTRASGMKSYYYLVPDISSNYLSGQTVVSTIHIICGIEVGMLSPYLVDFFPGSNVDYEKMIKFNRLKKLSDLEAAGLFYNNIGCKFYLDKNYGFAEYVLNFASNLYPDSPIIVDNLGVVYKKEGYYEKAMEQFFKALNSGGKVQTVVGNIISAKKYLSKERQREIELLLNDKLKTNYYWHLLIAEEYMKNKEFNKALKEIKIADKLSPENQRVYSYYIRYASLVEDKKMLEKYLKKIKYF